MRINKRDKEILKFVEDHKAITIKICANLFFSNSKNNYYSASRRLKILQENGLLKRFRKDVYSEAIYYEKGSPLSPHRIKLLELYSRLTMIGNVITFIKEYTVPCENMKRKNDGLIEIAVLDKEYEYTYPLIIEIDYTHDTSINKIKDLRDSGHFQELYDIMPIMIIVKRFEYQKKVYVNGVNIIYLNWDLEGIENIFDREE